jgi:hypothetical protein
MRNDWLTDYVDGLGYRIPASHFENEPGAPQRLSRFLSVEDLIRFYLGIITTRSAAAAIRASRSAMLH